MTLTTHQQIQALLGSAPLSLLALFDDPQPPQLTGPVIYQPYGANPTSTPATETRSDASLLGNLVYILDTYCKHTFRAPHVTRIASGGQT